MKRLPFFTFIPLLLVSSILVSYAKGNNKADSISKAKAKPKSDCRQMDRVFIKNICSNIENNKAMLIRYQFQVRSGENSQEKILQWARTWYPCIKCEKEPGFGGGSMLRKAVFDNATSVGDFLVKDAKVNVNIIEDDGVTLLDWLQIDIEANIELSFEIENKLDQKWLIQSLKNSIKFFDMLRANGAKFSSEL